MLFAQWAMNYLATQGYELVKPEPLPTLPPRSNVHRRYKHIIKSLDGPKQHIASPKGRNAKIRAHKRTKRLILPHEEQDLGVWSG